MEITIIKKLITLAVFANTSDVFGGFASQGNNLIGKTDGTNGFANGTNGDQTGTP